MAFSSGLSRRRLIIAGILAATMQTGILASMIREGSAILAEGQPVTLRTMPVDPRDLLRGDYVVLNYEFSSLDSTLVMGDWPASGTDAVLYVALTPDGDGIWHPASASFSPVTPGEGLVVLRSAPFRLDQTPERPASIRAEYGLERYYVPEGQGKELEKDRNQSRVLV